MIVMMALWMVACGGGGGSPGTTSGSTSPSNFSVNAPAETTLAIGQRASFSISGGLTPYTVTNSNASVVNASIVGAMLEVIPLKDGLANLVVAPTGGGARYSIAVTVVARSSVLQVLSPESIALRLGNTATYAVQGGVPPYRAVSSSPGVTTSDVVGGSVRLSAVGLGTASIEIYDSTSAAPVKREVSVVSTAALFTSAPAALTLAAGSQKAFSVSGGVAPYSVASSNAVLVDASLSGTTLSIVSFGSFGTGSIILKDSAGSSVSVAVTVGSSGSLFTTAPGDLTLQGGNSRTFSVGGGTGPYSATSSNNSIVTASISGTSLTLIPQNKGAAKINIVDTTGTAIAINVSVEQSGTSAVGSIDMIASAVTIKSAGEEVLVTAIVKNSANVGMSDQDVVFSATSGTLLSPSVKTDASGAATVRLSSGSDKTNRSIVVTARLGSVSKSITVDVVGTSLSIVGSSSLQLANSTIFSVRALDSSGNPISGASLNTNSSLGNNLSPSALTTDVNGNANFTYTAARSGVDQLTVNGLGVSKSVSLAVSSINFTVVSPAANTTVSVGNSQSVRVRYMDGGVPVAGRTVQFISTRGSVSPVGGQVLTDSNGEAAVSVSSSSAGIGVVTAQILSGISPQPLGEISVPLNFVATVPSVIRLQVNPGAVAPNPSGEANQATLEATVRDASGNPVANQQVGFTILADASNGRLSSGISITDSNGRASVNYISGALSTANDGVIVQTQVLPNSISTTVALTVNANSLFINIGYGNTINNLDTTTYSKPFSVYVTDANGNAVGNQTVILTAIPDPVGNLAYYKGRLAWGGTVWTYSDGPPASPTVFCANEDLNLNGVLDETDTNGDGRLTPGNIAVASPGSVVTDASGRAAFNLLYGEQFAPWSTVQISARATVSGTESRRAINFALTGLDSDFNVETSPPAGVLSPFGTSTVCSDRF